MSRSIAKLTIVEDVSVLVDLKDGESGLVVETWYPSEGVPDLEEFALRELGERPVVYFDEQVLENWGDSLGDLLEGIILADIVDDTKIVMAHYYDE